MGRIIRIGSRGSQLALWQARLVQEKLKNLGYDTVIVPIKSEGDVIVDEPLYGMGITGVFTRNLDIAMLEGAIDIAVHSMKDVPTALPKNIVNSAVLKRSCFGDILVYRGRPDSLEGDNIAIATGSLRRAAFWKNRFAKHKIHNIRGNVNTRLQKLKEGSWNGAIFAKAGLERLSLTENINYINLDWMVPAPAQGAIMVCAVQGDSFSNEACKKINDEKTKMCTQIERDFLQTLEGGCTAPIGALAMVEKGNINFRGSILSIDGTQRVDICKAVKYTEEIGRIFAEELLEKGGRKIIEQIKKK